MTRIALIFMVVVLLGATSDFYAQAIDDPAGSGCIELTWDDVAGTNKWRIGRSDIQPDFSGWQPAEPYAVLHEPSVNRLVDCYARDTAGEQEVRYRIVAVDAGDRIALGFAEWHED